VQADLKYTYELSGWSVEIGLGERVTIGDIMGSILGPNFCRVRGLRNVVSYGRMGYSEYCVVPFAGQVWALATRSRW
jgi:hypothetical protein